MPTTHILETAGEVCPFPLNEAKAAIATIPSGDLLRIDFDCTQATEAIPRWAAENGYPVTAFERVGMPAGRSPSPSPDITDIPPMGAVSHCGQFPQEGRRGKHGR